MNNRQGGGRRRGRNNNSNNNGGRPQGNGRGDSGNRIDSRARGNAAQLLEKYRNMARDAQLSGDRVMTEYYLQYADHYFRVLSDARNRQEEQRARFDGDGDDRDGASQPGGSDDEAEDIDELDAIDMIGRAPRNRGNGQANGNSYRDDRSREGSQRDGGQRDGGQRDGNRDYGRDRPRDDRPRDDRPRDDRPREDRPREERQREERSREERPRDDRPRDDRPREERGLRPRRDRPVRAPRDADDAPATLDLAVLPPAIGVDPAPRDEVPVASNDDAPAPKKRGRPRKVVSEGEAA